MTKEQIKQAAKKYRLARLKKEKGQTDPRIDILFDKFENAYIDGYCSRQPEIDELVDMIKAVNEFRYPPAELMQKINKLLKKYEQ